MGGLAKGIAQGLGLQSIASDPGLDLQMLFKNGAAAAMGMARRLGRRNIRHVDTSWPWIQSQARSGKARLEQIAGAENPADALTKHLASLDLLKHGSPMGVLFGDGRAAAAPQLTTPLANLAKSSKEVVRQSTHKQRTATSHAHVTNLWPRRCLCRADL